jgi:hypothetical protein
MTRAQRFHYTGLDTHGDSLAGHYDLDGVTFVERVSVHGADFSDPAQRALAELWYLVAGLSYYKAGAAHTIDLGTTPVGAAGRALFAAALHDGLGEYAFRNQIVLDDVRIVGGVDATAAHYVGTPKHVLIPFGGGIDSCVSVRALAHLERTLFVMSPTSGRFEPLEATAAVTGLPIARATRTLDLEALRSSSDFFNGHVPVTTMVTLLACISALAHGCEGVVMSNEHSSSAPNLEWRGNSVNHQWSKSHLAEVLIAAAVEERIGNDFTVASFLRDRSELWVAQMFAADTEMHHVFRSCNRAFAQRADERATQWCGVCDKCLFINLILAPFLSRASLRDIFHSEPLANPALETQLATLVGLGTEHKPFECVGDPDESAVALVEIAQRDEWRDVPHLAQLALRVSPDQRFDELLAPLGENRVPAHWL